VVNINAVVHRRTSRVSGSKLKVSNPYPRSRGTTFPWSRDRRLWLSSQTLFFEQRAREDLWLSATCAVVGNGERRSLRLKSRRGLSFRLHIWRTRTNIPENLVSSHYGTSIPNHRLSQSKSGRTSAPRLPQAHCGRLLGHNAQIQRWSSEPEMIRRTG
jgi:hypothetical protein